MHRLTERQYFAVERRVWLAEHLKVQNGRCKYCNTRINMADKTRSGNATIDHVIPLARGGIDEFKNTVAACGDCNLAKSDRNPEDFLRCEWLRNKIAAVAQPPDRLSVEAGSPFCDEYILSLNVGVRFNGREREDVIEYCVSEGWIRARIRGKKSRNGGWLALKINGVVEPYLRQGVVEP